MGCPALTINIHSYDDHNQEQTNYSSGNHQRFAGPIYYGDHRLFEFAVFLPVDSATPVVLHVDESRDIY